MKLSALVVGLGNVGMGYDLHAPRDIYVRTHARAFDLHPDFELVGGVEIDPGRRRLFESTFGRPAFDSVASAATILSPDVVAVSTRTERHAAAVMEVLNTMRPKAVLCEKPLAPLPDEARAIVSRCEQDGVALFVNYMRCSEPGAVEVGRRLGEGGIEAPIKGVAWYSKGLVHNGSHLYNLLSAWLGRPRGATVIAKGRRLAEGDGEPDVLVTYGCGDVVFLAAREECFSLYEIEIVAANGRLRYEEEGGRISWQPITADLDYPGHSILSKAPEVIPSDLRRYQLHVAEQISRALRRQPAHLCTGRDALDTLEQLHGFLH